MCACSRRPEHDGAVSPPNDRAAQLINLPDSGARLLARGRQVGDHIHGPKLSGLRQNSSRTALFKSSHVVSSGFCLKPVSFFEVPRLRSPRHALLIGPRAIPQERYCVT